MNKTISNIFEDEIVTERLKLRRMKYSDKQEILKIIMNEEVMTSTGLVGKLDSDKIFNQMLQGTEYVIVSKGSKTILGSVGIINRSDEHKWLEVGFEIDKHHWKKGYATEAIKAFVSYVFSETYFVRVEAFTFMDNYPSIRVLEKSGFLLEGHLKSRLIVNNKHKDYLLYSKINESKLIT